jgi:hypothetical protein
MYKIATASIAAVLLAFPAATILSQTAGTTSSSSSKAVAGDMEKVSADGKSITVKTAALSKDMSARMISAAQ